MVPYTPIVRNEEAEAGGQLSLGCIMSLSQFFFKCIYWEEMSSLGICPWKKHWDFGLLSMFQLLLLSINTIPLPCSISMTWFATIGPMQQGQTVWDLKSLSLWANINLFPCWADDFRHWIAEAEGWLMFLLPLLPFSFICFISYEFTWFFLYCFDGDSVLHRRLVAKGDL